MRMTPAIGVKTTSSRGTVRKSPARTMIGANEATGTCSGNARTTIATNAVAGEQQDELDEVGLAQGAGASAANDATPYVDACAARR